MFFPLSPDWGLSLSAPLYIVDKKKAKECVHSLANAYERSDKTKLYKITSCPQQLSW